MKWFLISVILLGFFNGYTATTYYSQGSLDPGLLSSWSDLPVAGAPPTSFTNAGDIFIIQNGHNMVTTSSWTIGAAGSILQIQNGGVLTGNHSIILTGTFQIDNGGKYIHNNNSSVSAVPGTSIWSGTESFAANSIVEIQNWINNIVPLPAGISWGNLIINLTSSLGGSWNQMGNLATVQGNLQIISSGTLAGQEFRITGVTNTVLNISGNIVIDGGILNLKSVNTAGSSCAVQVNGNISVNNTGILNVGTADVVLNSELRFKGNFSASVTSTVTSTDNNSYLVANGTSAQTLTCATTLSCNFRVAPGATVNQSGNLTNGSAKVFAVLGTYNDNAFLKTFSGSLEVAGGTFNSSGSLAMGLNLCRSCTGDGTYPGASAVWCTASGAKGRINFNTNSITFIQHPAAMLFAGSGGSPGDIYLTNGAIIGFTDLPVLGTGSIFLNPNSILSIDVNSYIIGSANYSGLGGTLRIGSADGITAVLNTTNGNIRVNGTKVYNSSGANSFEYFGTGIQVTGNGLPTSIPGTLKVNNTAGMGTSGVTLSQATSVNNILDLTSGKLTTSLANLITLSNTAFVNLPLPGASYVVGPMKKIGSTSFTFPIGKGNNYSPLSLTGVGVASDEYIAEYFTGNPRVVFGAPFQTPPIDHMSVLEWWTVDRSVGTTTKNVTLEATAYSDATLLTDLHILRWDGTIWNDEGNSGSVGVAAGPVTSNPVTNFFPAGSPTPFTFGSITSFQNPLLVNLVSFKALKLSSSAVLISWELSSECSPSAKFEIQKAGIGKNFVTIGVVAGSATSLTYHYSDNSLTNGINYYRLKMTDENGKISYSHVGEVLNGSMNLLLTSLIPTVITNTAILSIVSSSQQEFQLLVTDMQGRIVQRQNFNVGQGNANIEINVSRLSSGIYQLAAINSEGKTNMIRFIKE